MLIALERAAALGEEGAQSLVRPFLATRGPVEHRALEGPASAPAWLVVLDQPREGVVGGGGGLVEVPGPSPAAGRASPGSGAGGARRRTRRSGSTRRAARPGRRRRARRRRPAPSVRTPTRPRSCSVRSGSGRTSSKRSRAARATSDRRSRSASSTRSSRASTSTSAGSGRGSVVAGPGTVGASAGAGAASVPVRSTSAVSAAGTSSRTLAGTFGSASSGSWSTQRSSASRCSTRSLWWGGLVPGVETGREPARLLRVARRQQGRVARHAVLVVDDGRRVCPRQLGEHPRGDRLELHRRERVLRLGPARARAGRRSPAPGPGCPWRVANRRCAA